MGERGNQRVCCDGPYSLCRNPYLFFSVTGLTGFLLFLRMGRYLWAVIPAAFIICYFLIRTEEKWLKNNFAHVYEDYRQRVPRLWPKYSGYWSRAALAVTPYGILRSLAELNWLLLLFVIYVLHGRAHCPRLLHDIILPSLF